MKKSNVSTPLFEKVEIHEEAINELREMAGLERMKKKLVKNGKLKAAIIAQISFDVAVIGYLAAQFFGVL